MTSAKPLSARPALSPRDAARAVRTLFVVGLGLSLLMVWRSQVGGDQLNLLARGWRLAVDGVWIPYGNPMSTGGKAPGGITSLLVGLPLYLWRDHRAPTLLVCLLHGLGYWLLDRTLRGILTPLERVLLAVLYWLNPWRLFFSAFLWNPNYLFPVGAVHLWSALAQRERGRLWPSFLHAATLVLAFQIHASFLILAVASLLLWLRGAFKVHWPGAVLGALLAAIPLVPWVLGALAEPALVTGASKGFLGRGLLAVYPLARGLVYWLRYGSLAVAQRMVTFDFTDLLGRHPRFDRGASLVAMTVPWLTLLFPALANLRLLRRGRLLLRRRLSPALSARAWLKGYVLGCLVATAIVFALSPTTTMMWQGLVVLHAAILPLVFWVALLARSRWSARVLTGVRAYAAAEVVLLLAIAFGAAQYRCSGHTGEDSFGFPLRYDHPMLSGLHIQETCPWPVNQPGGWWPDALPAP
jgi:hypothetical protein